MHIYIYSFIILCIREQNESAIHIHIFSSFLDFLPIQATVEHTVGIPCGSDGKESACNAGDPV